MFKTETCPCTLRQCTSAGQTESKSGGEQRRTKTAKQMGGENKQTEKGHREKDSKSGDRARGSGKQKQGKDKK